MAHKGAADSDCRNTPLKLRSPGSESRASEDSDCRNPSLKLESPGSESSGSQGCRGLRLPKYLSKTSESWVGVQSKGSELSSFNLRGSKEVLKQQTRGTTKVWCVPILFRGKLHVVTSEDDFPGEEPAGAKELVQKLLIAVNVRFSRSPSKPSLVFVDRGRGFYNPGNGKITPAFQTALAECHFKAFWGDDASVQPGHL